MWICTGAELILAGVAWALIAQGELSSRTTERLTIAAVCLTVSAAVFPIAMYLAGKRWLRLMRDPRRFGEVIEVVFGEHAIEHRGPLTAGLIRWATFDDVLDTPDAVILRNEADHTSICVPVANLTPSEAAPKLRARFEELRQRS